MADGRLEYNIIDDISVYWGRISPKTYVDTDEGCSGGKKSGKGKEKGKAKKQMYILCKYGRGGGDRCCFDK